MADIHLHEADVAGNNPYEGVLVVTQYPFGGKDVNSGARYLQTANLLGVDILAMQATGTGHRAARPDGWLSTRPKRFLGMCAMDYKQVLPYIEGYDTVVGWGDSGRGANIMGMQLECNAFDRLLIRDGVNLKAPQYRRDGWRDFVSYQRTGERDKPVDTADVPMASRLDRMALPRRLATTIAIGAASLLEAANYTEQLRSTYTKSAAEILAIDTSLPMRVVSLTHSFTGSPEQAEIFNTDLVSRREKAFDRQRDDPVARQAELVATLEPGYHSDLLRPQLAAEHLHQALLLAD